MIILPSVCFTEPFFHVSEFFKGRFGGTVDTRYELVLSFLIVLGTVIFHNKHIKVDNKVNNKVYNNLTINCSVFKSYI